MSLLIQSLGNRLLCSNPSCPCSLVCSIHSQGITPSFHQLLFPFFHPSLVTKYKHHTAPPVTLVVHSTSSICPVFAMSGYLLIRGNALGRLFIFHIQTSFTQVFFGYLFQCLDQLSLNPPCCKPQIF